MSQPQLHSGVAALPRARTLSMPSQRRRGGFTLVEILIVVVILGILAAIVVPQFTSAASETRENTVRMNVHRIRQQIEIYQQHHAAYPTAANFANQMTLSTNAAGQTAPIGTEGYPFGPYIREVPVNPFTGTRDVGSGEVGTSAWYYNETTGAFHANDSEETRAY